MIMKSRQWVTLSSKTKCRDTLELVFAFGLICVILPLISIPVILRFIKSPNHVLSEVSNCSTSTLTVYSTPAAECVSELYTGDLCTGLLTATQTCAVGRIRNSILVNASSVQQVLERNLTILLEILQEYNGSQQCRDAMLPFMCQYTFPLCDNNTKQLYLPTQEQCIEISEQVCSQEWNLTKQLGYQNLLPNCTTLRRLPTAMKTLICRDDFVNLNGTCYPRCDRTKAQNRTALIINRILRFICAASAILGGGTFFVASIIRYKVMFTFPLILLVYMMADNFIFGVVFLVAELGHPMLLCSSISLLHSIQNPTILCYISGAVFHYAIIGVHIFWTFHVCFLFYKVMFPFHANAHKSYQRYIHLIMIFVGFFVPLPSVIIALAMDDYKYSIGLFPNSICFPRHKDYFFYSMSLVVIILLMISMVLLVILFWKLHKHSEIFRKKPGQLSLLSTAEKKLLLVLSLSIFAGLMTVIVTSIVQLIVSEQTSRMLQYFSCESNGYVPGRCNYEPTESDSVLWLSSFALLIFGVNPPLLNLVFVINFKAIQKKIRKNFFGQSTSNLCQPNIGHRQQSRQLFIQA